MSPLFSPPLCLFNVYAAGAAAIEFERQAGTMVDLDKMEKRVATRLKVVTERHRKAAEKAGKEHERKDAAKGKKRARQQASDGANASRAPAGPTERAVKRVRNDGAEVMLPQDQACAVAHESSPMEFDRGVEGPEEVSKASRSKTEGGSDAKTADDFAHDSSTYTTSVFLKNLDFKVDEAQVKAAMAPCGAIQEVRLVRKANGQSKGFAYVQFKAVAAVAPALAMNRQKLAGRPMFIEKCVDKKASTNAKTGFESRTYSHTIETSVLFVRSLAFDVTEKEVRDAFEEFGALKEVRLSLKPNGKSKGFAYVEFIDEKAAQAAIMGANGRIIKGREIAVEISNPPSRKSQGGSIFLASSSRAGSSGGGGGGDPWPTKGLGPGSGGGGGNAVTTKSSVSSLRPRNVGRAGGTRRGPKLQLGGITRPHAVASTTVASGGGGSASSAGNPAKKKSNAQFSALFQ
jgi:RNA recognition motif-containing protein